MFGPVTYRSSRKHGCMLGCMIAVIFVVGVGAGVARQGIASMLMLMFSIGFALFWYAQGSSIYNKPRIKIDDEGIAVAEWLWVKVAWQNVRAVHIVNVSREGACIVLELDNEEYYWQQLPRSLRPALWMNRWWRSGRFSFSIEWLDAPKKEIIAEVRQRAGLDPQGRPLFWLDAEKK